jgi:murein DD-endopeptidase MepM/ murein hydrolase activator NlpD
MAGPAAAFAIKKLIKPVIAAVLFGCFCTLVFVVVLTSDGPANACPGGASGGYAAQPAADTSGVDVDVKPVDGLSAEQTKIAATIISVGRGRGINDRGILIALMVGLGESSLTNVSHGDWARNDTIGVFQIGPEHSEHPIGSQANYDDRMSPAWAAGNFYDRMLAVPGWEAKSYTEVGHEAQRNLDPNHYATYEAQALDIFAALDGRGAALAVAAPCSTGMTVGGAFIHPIEGAPITSPFGHRGSPGGVGSTNHEGTDYGEPCGTPFHAIASGTVISSGPASGYGHWIRIDHGSGIISEYGHMFADGLLVKVSDQVAQGQVIGKVGSDGHSTGCHLHLTIRVNGEAVDPEKFLAAAAAQAKQVATGTGTLGDGFRVASFNTLGASHTAGGAQHPGMASGAARTPGLVKLLASHGTQIVGMQEFQPSQQQAFHDLAGGTWATYGIQDNVIAWRRDAFTLVTRDSITIPYFDGNKRQMPIATLRVNSTGQLVTVINIHNPADIRDSPHNADSRAEAIRRERAWITHHGQHPILMTGDFNDRELAFCGMTGGGLMTAAAGGSNTGSCQMPSYHGIDWIFGRGVGWNGFIVDRSPIGTVSDHPFVTAATRF